MPPPPLSLDVSKYSKSKQKRNKIGTAMTLQPRNSFSFHFTHKNEKKRTPAPLVNVYSTWPRHLVTPASPGRYSTNWDRKGWPGSEIQMYHGCPWHYINLITTISFEQYIVYLKYFKLNILLKKCQFKFSAKRNGQICFGVWSVLNLNHNL